MAELAARRDHRASARDRRQHPGPRSDWCSSATVQTASISKWRRPRRMVGIALRWFRLRDAGAEKRQRLTTEGDSTWSATGPGWPRHRTAAPAGIRSACSSTRPRASQGERPTQGDCIEIHTGSYCTRARSRTGVGTGQDREAIKAGKRLRAGGPCRPRLNYVNIRRWWPSAASRIQHRHSIISRAVLVGMDRAVREMVELVNGGRVILDLATFWSGTERFRGSWPGKTDAIGAPVHRRRAGLLPTIRPAAPAARFTAKGSRDEGLRLGWRTGYLARFRGGARSPWSPRPGLSGRAADCRTARDSVVHLLLQPHRRLRRRT